MPRINVPVGITIDLPEPTESMLSIFAFGVHKSGSTLLHSMLRDIFLETQISTVSFDDLLFERGFDINDPLIKVAITPFLKKTRLRVHWRANVLV